MRNKQKFHQQKTTVSSSRNCCFFQTILQNSLESADKLSFQCETFFKFFMAKRFNTFSFDNAKVYNRAIFFFYI